jgi:hypothetical protein
MKVEARGDDARVDGGGIVSNGCVPITIYRTRVEVTRASAATYLRGRLLLGESACTSMSDPLAAKYAF